jgi:hypothetical protein
MVISESALMSVWLINAGQPEYNGTRTLKNIIEVL